MESNQNSIYPNYYNYNKNYNLYDQLRDQGGQNNPSHLHDMNHTPRATNIQLGNYTGAATNINNNDGHGLNNIPMSQMSGISSQSSEFSHHNPGSTSTHGTSYHSYAPNSQGIHSATTSPLLHSNRATMNSPNMSINHMNLNNMNHMNLNPMNINHSPWNNSEGITKPTTYIKDAKDAKDQEIEKYKLQLNLKSQIITNLKKKLEGSPQTKVNEKFYKLYQEVSSKLHEKELELAKVNQVLETLMVSVTLNQNSDKKFDEQELAHKIVNKMNSLISENATLLDMISKSSKSSLLIEIGLLKNEIKLLKRELHSGP